VHKEKEESGHKKMKRNLNKLTNKKLSSNFALLFNLNLTYKIEKKMYVDDLKYQTGNDNNPASVLNF